MVEDELGFERDGGGGRVFIVVFNLKRWSMNEKINGAAADRIQLESARGRVAGFSAGDDTALTE